MMSAVGKHNDQNGQQVDALTLDGVSYCRSHMSGRVVALLLLSGTATPVPASYVFLVHLEHITKWPRL